MPAIAAATMLIPADGTQSASAILGAIFGEPSLVALLASGYREDMKTTTTAVALVPADKAESTATILESSTGEGRRDAKMSSKKRWGMKGGSPLGFSATGDYLEFHESGGGYFNHKIHLSNADMNMLKEFVIFWKSKKQTEVHQVHQISKTIFFDKDKVADDLCKLVHEHTHDKCKFCCMPTESLVFSVV